ncbi:GIY-YIG nuclease family protein [Aeromonas sp. 23P]|uniref:GIY-YIG nuclease family protein n=1 Tax=Aeromonas sp. 23P TaxID=3452716 RepID=UPI003F79D07F
MGYIYILSNKYYRHGKLLKIGMTSRTVERRAKELSGAFGVPDDFSIVFKKQVKFPSVAEKRNTQEAILTQNKQKERVFSG